MWLFGRTSFYFSSTSVLDVLSVRNTMFSGIQKLKRIEIAMPDYSVLIFWYGLLLMFVC